MGFTSPVLTAMMVLDDDAVFTDSHINKLSGGDTFTIASTDAALFSSIVNIGAMLGSILAGFACDKFGR